MESEIVIISESGDKSTNKVLEWLDFYGKKPKRINVDSDFENLNIQITNEATTDIESKTIWNRRGYLPTLPAVLKRTEWIDYLKKEQLVATFEFERINNQNIVGSYYNEYSNNKLLNLHTASKIGLKIPNTIVINNKADLSKFIQEDKEYITKPLNKSPYLEINNSIYYGNGTSILDIGLIPDYFAPSLVQEYIEKEVEIRVFFIEDYFYAMAIFSQNDEKTKIDFRNYNEEKPNRNVPFLLPEKVLSKLKLFSKRIDCNTGSIDLILTPKGEYVFLEINPMGQYDWLSEGCNFYIDKKIAEFLIEKSENEKRN